MSDGKVQNDAGRDSGRDSGKDSVAGGLASGGLVGSGGPVGSSGAAETFAREKAARRVEEERNELLGMIYELVCALDFEGPQIGKVLAGVKRARIIMQRFGTRYCGVLPNDAIVRGD